MKEVLEYKFKDKELFNKALRHKSFANEKNIESYEKLEFLGDSILGFLVSEYIFSNYKKLKEGEMTKLRATVVCEDSLYKVALNLNLENKILLGNSEKKDKRGIKKSIIADIVEAIIAAIFLDGGIENARKFVIKNFKELIEEASNNIGKKDFKTVLQEKIQVNGNRKIEYMVLKEDGPDHNKIFEIGIKIDDVLIAKGEGTSKKKAEMEAAKNAILLLKE